MSAGNFYQYLDLIGLDRTRVKIYYGFDISGDVSVANEAADAHGGAAAIVNKNVFFWANSGEGFFSCDTYLRPNLSGYGSPDSGDWTMFFMYEKVFRDSYTDDELTNEILFSNLNSGSGFTIGTNGVGNFFFETVDSSGINYFYVGNLAYSPTQACYVVKNGNYVFFGGYDSGTNSLGIEAVYLQNGTISSNDWKIAKANETGYGQFEGNMQEYCFMTGALDFPVLSLLISGLIGNHISGGFVKETGYVSGITGYQNQVTMLTGVTGYSAVATGFDTDNCGNVRILYSTTPLTGIISFTGTIPVPGNVFYQKWVITGQTDILIDEASGMYWDTFANASGFDGISFVSGLSGVYNNYNAFFNIL